MRHLNFEKLVNDNDTRWLWETDLSANVQQRIACDVFKINSIFVALFDQFGNREGVISTCRSDDWDMRRGDWPRKGSKICRHHGRKCSRQNSKTLEDTGDNESYLLICSHVRVQIFIFRNSRAAWEMKVAIRKSSLNASRQIAARSDFILGSQRLMAQWGPQFFFSVVPNHRPSTSRSSNMRHLSTTHKHCRLFPR